MSEEVAFFLGGGAVFLQRQSELFNTLTFFLKRNCNDKKIM